MKKLVIFVCNGNIHRSVIAAECFSKTLKENKIDNLEVQSYGIQGTLGTTAPLHNKLEEYPEEYNAAKSTLEKLGIDISAHTYQPITRAIMQEASVVIAMDQKVLRDAENSLITQFPEFINKIHIISELSEGKENSPDPAGNGDLDVHQKLILYIHDTMANNFNKIISWAN